MKKLLFILVLGIFLAGCGPSGREVQDDLMYTLNKIESDLDLCIETQDKSYCEQLIISEPLMLIVSNDKLMTELNKCLPSDKCYSTMYRVTMKGLEAISIFTDTWPTTYEWEEMNYE